MLNSGGYPSNLTHEPDDGCDDALTDFEGALVTALKRAAKQAGVELYFSPTVDCTREGRCIRVATTLVNQMREAYRAVLSLRAQGINPQVIYANFGDLLTASVCGIEKRRAG